MRSSKYNAETLAPIVQRSRSIAEVLRRLGLRPTGGNHRMIAARVRQAGLDTSHFVYGRRGSARADIPSEALARLVRESTSVAQVLSKLELATEGRIHADIARRIRELGLDTTHFTGRSWARGETKRSHPSLALRSQRSAWPDAKVFVENSPLINGPRLVHRLLAAGWPYRCAWCDISEWRGMPLVLHLDHINGINNDNRIVNLRFLCPNCHSQTDTYCNRRRDAAVL